MVSHKIVLFLATVGSLLISAAFAQQPSKNLTICLTHKSSLCKSYSAHSLVKSHKSLAGKPVNTGTLADMRPLNPAISQALGDSFNFSRAGDADVKQSAWQEAEKNYQQALALVPNNREALYGMARCAKIKGDTAAALHYYRIAIYSSDPSRYGTVPGDGYQENMVDKLMEYVVLLSQTGHNQEALSVYLRASGLLNYEQGRPILKVLLPELVAERTLPAQVRYTPERLQALADTALAHEEMAFGSDKEALAHMQKAVKLYPDSPVTNYYLGDALLMRDRAGAKAAYQKAVELGDEPTIAAAKERIGMCQ